MGKRVFLPQMVDVRYTWELSFEFLRSAQWTGDGGGFSELEGLTAFYLAQAMAGTCFAYTDDEDNTASLAPFGQGDGTTTAFQIVRARDDYVEKILIPTITQLRVAGVAKTAGVDFVQSDKGIVTFTVAPTLGQALDWSGTFAWLCRFDDDVLQGSRNAVGLSDIKSVKFSNEINP